MGGVVDAETIERIAHLGSVEELPLEDVAERSQFETDATFVTLPGDAVFQDDQQIEPGGDELSFLYLEPLDEDWVSETQMTVGVFTTPTESVGGTSLNPLARVSEESFVTAEGGRYLAQSGMLEKTGLGSSLSWVVTPAEVGSQSVDFLGTSAPLSSYLGVVEAGSSVVRTLLVHVAKVELDEEVAVGAGVQHRELWSDASDSEAQALIEELSSQSVDALVGTGEDSLVRESAIGASAETVAELLSNTSLESS
jgi:hypothetical protein